MAQSLRTLKGVGEKTEKLFQKVGIYDTDDLLHYYPRNYDEYETPVDIAERLRRRRCRPSPLRYVPAFMLIP